MRENKKEPHLDLPFTGAAFS